MQVLAVQEDRRSSQRRKSNISASVLSEMSRQIEALVLHVRSKHLPVDILDDVRAQSYLYSVKAAPRFDPKKPNADGFFFEISRRQIWPQINRWLASVTISKAMSRSGNFGAQFIARSMYVGRNQEETVDDSLVRIDFENREAIASENPEECYFRSERRRHYWHLGIKLRREIEARTRHLPEDVRAVGELMVGLEGTATSVKEVARKLGTSTTIVRRSWVKYRREIEGVIEVDSLRRQMKLLEDQV